MREQLDAHGDFATKIDGTMEFKDYLVLRSVIARQSIRLFAPMKLKFKQKGYEIFLTQNQQDYLANFAQAQRGYNEAVIFITKKACEWIEFDFKNY